MTDLNQVFSDAAWEKRANGKLLVYFGPHLRENLSRGDVRAFLRSKGAWGAVWNYEWDSPGGPWYSYVCDTVGYDLEKIQSKNSRKTIRRSLERCQVRHVSAEWLAEHAYETHAKAASRYRNYTIVSRETFSRQMRALDPLPGLLLYGVFVEENLAAFGIARDFGQTVRFSIAEFDPEYLHAKPMYALYYTIANECLNGSAKDIDAGWRPFVHDTEIEEFFRRMGWRQAPCRIDLYLLWPARIMLWLAKFIHRPLRLLLPSRYWAALEGLLVADDVARRSRDSIAEAAPSSVSASRRDLVESDPRWKEGAEIERSWRIAPYTNPPTGWQVYSLDFVLSAMQGSLTERYQIKKSMQWLVFGTIVRSLMVVGQAIIMLLAWIPIISSLLEVMARTFTRNAAGFFLRSCYWKARLGSLGGDTLIDQGVEIWGPANVSIGSRCHIDTNVRLAAGERRHGQRGSIFIGDYVHVGPNVHISGRGGVAIGNLVGISAAAHLYSATNMVESPRDSGELISMSHMAPRDQQHVYEAPIVVEDHAFIGMMARIMPGVTIGRGAIVHADTEVTRSIPPFANYGGIPRGRQIGWRKPRRPSPKLAAPPGSCAVPESVPSNVPPMPEAGDPKDAGGASGT